MQAIKNTVRGLAARMGIEIRRMRDAGESRSAAEEVRPFATFAPWNLDPEFLRVYSIVRGNTMVDLYRLYELWTLVEQVADVPGDIVEIGVWRGGSGGLLGYRARQLCADATVYLCDTFKGMVKTSERDPLYRGGELSDTSVATVDDLVHKRLQLANVRILPGIFPEDSAHLFQGDQVRLCHVDVDVYRSAEDILRWVWPRMPPGGLVVYDDYGFPTCAGVAEHVDAQRALRDRVVIHNLNGHAIVVKLR